MKISIKFHREEMWRDFFLHQIYLLIKENKWKWHSILALITLSAGLLSPVIGTVLNLTIWFIPISHFRTLLYQTSMVFYVLTLPLLALGSQCLDLLEKKSRGLNIGKLIECRTTNTINPKFADETKWHF